MQLTENVRKFKQYNGIGKPTFRSSIDIQFHGFLFSII